MIDPELIAILEQIPAAITKAIVDVYKGYPNHAGRPGKVGGSVPKGTGAVSIADLDQASKAAGKILGVSQEQASGFLSEAFSYHDEATGYSTSLTKAYEADDGSVVITGAIHDKDGQEVGQFIRNVLPGKEVHHDYFKMEESAQGSGFGSSFYKHAEDSYSAIGVKSITMQANLEVGGYAWARMGFNFDEPSSLLKAQQRLGKAYKKRYKKDLFPNEEPKTAYGIAAFTGPDGHRLGKDALLGSKWWATKSLSKSDPGFKAGKAYYKAKGKK